MRTIQQLLIIGCLFLAFGCKKPEEFPITPAIELKEIYSERDTGNYDQDVIVVFNFTDGDGDIGYYAPETGLNDPIFDTPGGQYYNNFIVAIWRKTNGVWEKDTVAANGDPLDISARLPYLTPTGKNKALKGEIKRTLPVDAGLRNDTFRYDIFIYDRGLHSSNVVTTPEIILRTR